MNEVLKHTPGEWRVEERSSYFGVFAKPPQDWYDRVRLVATCGKPHPDAEANARLIAAAPGLAADGQFLLDRLDDFERELLDDEVARHFNGHVSPAIARFRAAIAKAGNQ